MKKMLRNVLVLAVILVSGQAHAQYSYGLEPGVNVYANGLGTGGSLGLRFKNFIDDDGTVYFSSLIGFGFPKTLKSTLTAETNDIFVSKQTISVPLTQKMTLGFCDLEIGKLFTGDYEDGGVMGFAALDMCFFHVKNTIGNYDRDIYYLNSRPDDKEFGGTVHLRVGAGYLIRTGILGIVPTLGYSFAVIPANNEDTDFHVPNFLNIGVRVLFFLE